jgi:hypothetical protein
MEKTFREKNPPRQAISTFILFLFETHFYEQIAPVDFNKSMS